jgi:hypothetical protein
MHVLNKLENVVNLPIDETSVIPDNAEPDFPLFPMVIVPDLRDRDVEPVLRSSNDAFENAPLGLQGLAFVYPDIDDADTDNHMSRLGSQAEACSNFEF